MSDTRPDPREGTAPADTPTEAVRRLADRLLPLFYDDLRRIAHRERVRGGPGGTLQTTELVHEAYLKLRNARDWNDDAHFLRSAALAMRHALVNHACERRAAKRGGGAAHVPLDLAPELAAEDAADERLLALHEALDRLAGHAPRVAAVVECRYFGGCDEAETARALGVSERTVRRDWKLGRAWLYRELEEGA
ncbi:ECF-type sigma factor [Marilutibacter alkalisoli]|uniref:Sigma-70 family RNA polymerase sigma factor n=1 Tax=Marilutibacter alkalisoli TaxID=2591633 RepID=A0A514BUQ4_9GAMM|nr:ECF-type sigma factor [Lysobacter alkalisoli]QDH71096.1 sigma-70 family RNA polymerase sigma factor [Lysobacter alkalisoli]